MMNISPPMVGVPCLDMCQVGPSSLMDWPAFSRRGRGSAACLRWPVTTRHHHAATRIVDFHHFLSYLPSSFSGDARSAPFIYRDFFGKGRAIFLSSRGRLVPRRSPGSLVALARQYDHVARPALGQGQANGRPAVGLHRRWGRSLSQPARTVTEMASGSSVRGLSEVTTTDRRGSPATAPITGRLVLSRSPPQPNRQMTRPWVRPGRACRTFSRASGVWA